jgi:transposase
MELDPRRSGYFVFCNKTRHLLKILYWDKTGFALWYKRLEKNKFPWPKDSNEVKTLDSVQIEWLLSGIDFFKSHQALDYEVSF